MRQSQRQKRKFGSADLTDKVWSMAEQMRLSSRERGHNGRREQSIDSCRQRLKFPIQHGAASIRLQGTGTRNVSAGRGSRYKNKVFIREEDHENHEGEFDPAKYKGWKKSCIADVDSQNVRSFAEVSSTWHKLFWNHRTLLFSKQNSTFAFFFKCRWLLDLNNNSKMNHHRDISLYDTRITKDGVNYS